VQSEHTYRQRVLRLILSKIMPICMPTRSLAHPGAHPANATPWLEAASDTLDACLSLLTHTADTP
jgi:hypothetical protein